MGSQALDSLGESIHKMIDYHVREYNMTYSEVIGCLEIVKIQIYEEGKEEDEEVDDGTTQD